MPAFILLRRIGLIHVLFTCAVALLSEAASAGEPKASSPAQVHSKIDATDSIADVDNNSRRLSTEEALNSLPWKSNSNFKVPIPITSEKTNLLDRPVLFAMGGQLGLFTPFRSLLIERDFHHGRADFSAIVLPSPAAQLAVGPYPGRIIACAVASDGGNYKSADILFFNILTIGMREARFSGHTKPPWRIVFSNDGSRMVTCSDDGTIRLWVADVGPDPPGRVSDKKQTVGDQIAEFAGYAGGDNGNNVRGEFAAFSPYGMFLATAHEHTVTFRSPKDGSEKFTWEPDSTSHRRVMVLRFDPNGNTLFAFLANAKPTKNSTPKFWQYDVETHEAWPFEGTHGVVDGHITEDGKMMITWDGSSQIVFWDVSTRKEVAVLKVAPNNIYNVAFSPMGDVMATAGDDGEVRFWKIADRSQLVPDSGYTLENVDLIQFSLDGKHMITTSDDGWLKCWNAPDFCWDKRSHESLAGCSIDQDGVIIKTYKDDSKDRSIWGQIPLFDNSPRRTEERHPDGTVIETLPDGTIKKYKQH